jgi:hypothetical protein
VTDETDGTIKAKDIEPWRCTSVYEHDSAAWHLHPELVNDDKPTSPTCYLCQECYLQGVKKGKPPTYSIANGIDFGSYRRLGLEPLNLHEQLILSRVRLMFALVKVTSNQSGQRDYIGHNQFRCHAIMFPHDGPEEASKIDYHTLFEEKGCFDKERLARLMLFYMVDDKGNPDFLAAKIFRSTRLLARPWVLAQWLVVLHRLNPAYKDLELGDTYELIQKIKERLEDNEKSMLDEPLCIHKKEAMEFEGKIGSDVANVQQTEEPMPRLQPRGERPHTEAMKFSYVTRREDTYLLDGNDDAKLRAFRDLLVSPKDEPVLPVVENADDDGVDSSDEETPEDDDPTKIYLPHGLPVSVFHQQDQQCQDDERMLQSEPVDISREKDPCDTFKDTELAASAFPHVFMFGKAYGRLIGRLSQDQRIHLLSQFNCIPSQDRRLLAYMFDMLQRMRVFDGVKAYVNGNRDSLKAIHELLQDEQKRLELRRACEDPKEPQNKRLLESYYAHLKFAGINIPYSAVEGSKFKWRARALNRRYGPPTCFLTISPTNLDNPRSIRMSYHTISNEQFPAVFEENCPHG